MPSVTTHQDIISSLGQAGGNIIPTQWTIAFVAAAIISIIYVRWRRCLFMLGPNSVQRIPVHLQRSQSDNLVPENGLRHRAL